MYNIHIIVYLLGFGYRFSRSELGITNTETESDFYKNFQPWLQNRLSIHTVNAWDKIILLTCIRPVRKFIKQSVSGFEDVFRSARLDVIMRARDSYC